MAHPRILQQQLLDLIRTTFDDGRELPTDEAIAERFNLSGIEAARSLYADLADRGAITIKGFGPSRVITLGRNTVAPPPVRPIPSVVKRTDGARDGSVDAGMAKIAAVLARGRAAIAPETMRAAAAKPIPVSPALDRSSGTEGSGEGAQQGLSPARVAAPHPIVGMEMPRPPKPAASPVARQCRGKGQKIGFILPADDLAKLEDVAASASVKPTQFARDLLLMALRKDMSAPGRGKIPAPIAAAAIRDGFPVVEFAQRMMVLGLAAYSHEAALS